MTDSQQKVFAWMATHPGWHRPSQITPDNYDGGAAVIGRVLRSLIEQGRVEVSQQDRGNGTTCLVYRCRSAIKLRSKVAAGRMPPL